MQLTEFETHCQQVLRKASSIEDENEQDDFILIEYAKIKRQVDNFRSGHICVFSLGSLAGMIQEWRTV